MMKERVLNEAEIVAAAEHVRNHFLTAEAITGPLRELRSRRVVCMWTLVVGWLIRAGYSMDRSVQVADYMVANDMIGELANV